jgi:hypothetical protein
MGQLRERTCINSVGLGQTPHRFREAVALPWIHDGDGVASSLHRAINSHFIAPVTPRCSKLNLPPNARRKQLVIADGRVGERGDVSVSAKCYIESGFGDIDGDLPRQGSSAPILVNPNLNSSNCSDSSRNGSNHVPYAR